MAKVYFDSAIRGITGRLGDAVYFRRGDDCFVRHAPKKPAPPATPAQLATRQRMKRATVRASELLQDAATRAYYERRLPPQYRFRLWSLVTKDVLVAPRIPSIRWGWHRYDGRRGIVIEAVDNVGVTSVHLVVRAPDGSVVEAGQAELERGRYWFLRPKADLTRDTECMVEVTAHDMAGNETRATQTCAGLFADKLPC